MKYRLHQLDQLLSRFAWLWRPQAFKEIRPAWCAQLPELSATLLVLSDAEADDFERDNGLLLAWLERFIPELKPLAELCQLPQWQPSMLSLSEARFGWQVPGRKKLQIDAFCQAITGVHAPLLEWCGGKGHLGRSLAMLWQQSVETVEWDASLCEAGKRLSERVGLDHVFHVEDAMHESTQLRLHDKHVIALHACGDLHRQLIHAARREKIRTMNLVPCCYHLGRNKLYHAFNESLTLQLSRDDLRLSVTNSGTASAAQVKLRNQEMAWKLAYDCLRRQRSPKLPYSNIRPIDKTWLKLTFATFCQQLARRDGVVINHGMDWQQLEQQGCQRYHEVMRLNLVRFAFRRALELWLVLDMATELQQLGYTVNVTEFCDRHITPRNILLSVNAG